MNLASYYPSNIHNFGVAPRYLENLWAAGRISINTNTKVTSRPTDGCRPRTLCYRPDVSDWLPCIITPSMVSLLHRTPASARSLSDCRYFRKKDKRLAVDDKLRVIYKLWSWNRIPICVLNSKGTDSFIFVPFESYVFL